VDIFTRLVLLAGAAALVWYALRPRYVFLVRIDGGVPRLTKGLATSAFLLEAGQVCDECGVTDGWFGGVRRGKGIRLAFSRRLPAPCRQRLRNLWQIHG
jgi:hypothetical protein